MNPPTCQDCIHLFVCKHRDQRIRKEERRHVYFKEPRSSDEELDTTAETCADYAQKGDPHGDPH